MCSGVEPSWLTWNCRKKYGYAIKTGTATDLDQAVYGVSVTRAVQMDTTIVFADLVLPLSGSSLPFPPPPPPSRHNSIRRASSRAQSRPSSSPQDSTSWPVSSNLTRGSMAICSLSPETGPRSRFLQNSEFQT